MMWYHIDRRKAHTALADFHDKAAEHAIATKALKEQVAEHVVKTRALEDKKLKLETQLATAEKRIEDFVRADRENKKARELETSGAIQAILGEQQEVVVKLE